MSDKKHIDRLFQEKFKDFDVAPTEAMWSRIENDLPRKRKRRTVLLWWQLGGVAAVILLLLTVGISVFSPDTPNELPVVDTEMDSGNSSNSDRKDIINPELEDNNSIVNTEDDITNNEFEENRPENFKKRLQDADRVANSKTKNRANEQKNNSSKSDRLRANEANSKVAYIDNSKNTSEVNASIIEKEDAKSELKEVIENSEEAVVENSDNSVNTQNVVDNTSSDNTELNESLNLEEELKKKSIQEAIAEQEDLINEKEEDKQSRWSIAPNVAPVYFSSLGEGSPIDSQFNENSKGSNVSMSYGISGSYELSNRVKVRVGVNSLNLTQTTSDVFAFTGAEIGGASRMAQMDNVDYKGGTNSYAVMNSAMMSRMPSPESFNADLSGELEQRFGFIEVPVELEYRVLDKKFGVNVIGGFSTFFLNNNELYADVQGTSTLIGEATNINSTSFSANFGLGMDYSLSNKWKINLEPMFKYQINTFNNTSGEFRPFFIGVYSGLSFKF